MKLKPYPEYKDSSRPWLGNIPVHWDLVPAFAAFKERQETNKGLLESQVLSLSYGRIIKKREDALHGLVPASFETYQIVEPGNLILRLTDLQNDQRSLRVGLVKDRGIITSAYICISPCKPLLPDFAYYFLHAADVQKVFYSMGSGLRQSMGFVDLKHLLISIPDIEEQKQIVRFLDARGRAVDRFIYAKRRMIELLMEQKIAIVNCAITRGLDPNVSMKPSRIEWLGEIPAHWEVKRARYLFREINERSETGLETHLSMSQRFGLIETNRIEEKTLQSETQEGFKLCQVDDLVLNRLKAHLGIFARATISGLVSPDYTVFRLKVEANVQYFETLFRHPAYVAAFNKAVRGIVVGFLRLYTPEFNDICTLFPPKKEQDRIVGFIQDETAKFDHIINRANREIDLIKEYRTRLITDVVMGKLDVRDVVVADLEEADNFALLNDEMIDDTLEDSKELEPLEESVYADN